MNRQTNIILVLLMLTTQTAVGQVRCHVEGKVLTERWGGDVVICPDGTDLRVDDRPEFHYKANGGQFSADLEADMPVLYNVFLNGQRESGSWFTGLFIVEDGTVNITIPDNRAVEVTSTGHEGRLLQQMDSVEQVLIWQEVDRIDSLFESPETKTLYLQPRFIELVTALRSDDIQAKPEAYIDSLRREMEYYREDIRRSYTDAGWALKLRGDSITNGLHPFRLAYYAEHPMLSALYEIQQTLAQPGSKWTEDMAQLYEKQYRTLYPDHPVHQQIATALTALRLQPGQPYIDYDVRSEDGTLVPISSLIKGRVALIDLWASWCGPCRVHSKAMIPVYERYKDQGFTVVAIAREQKAEAMQQAMEHDGYPWPSLLDLNDELDIWSKNGAGNSGGAMFLIDRDGTILSTSTDAEELDALIGKALNSN